jgi:hypothetical protein
MALVLFQRVWGGFVVPLVCGQWDFTDPWQPDQILTLGL